MQTNDEAGDALEQVHRIHPVLDRLRDLLTSATALDMRASAKGYWSDQLEEGERTITSP